LRLWQKISRDYLDDIIALPDAPQYGRHRGVECSDLRAFFQIESEKVLVRSATIGGAIKNSQARTSAARESEPPLVVDCREFEFASYIDAQTSPMPWLVVLKTYTSILLYSSKLCHL